MEIGNLSLSPLDWLVLMIMITGALNWGLVGVGLLADIHANLVDLVFGSVPFVENLIYLLFGVAGVYTSYIAYQIYESG